MKHCKTRRPRRCFTFKEKRKILKKIQEERPFNYIELAPLLSEHGKEMVLRWYYREGIKEWWKTQGLYGNDLELSR